MKLKLKIKDRFGLIELIPQNSSLTENIISNDIREKVIFDSNEIDSINLRTEKTENGIQNVWDSEKDIDKEFDFTEKEMSFLKSCLNKRDAERSLSLEYVKVHKMINDAKIED